MRFLCQYTENDVKRPENWFRKNVWMEVMFRIPIRILILSLYEF